MEFNKWLAYLAKCVFCQGEQGHTANLDGCIVGMRLWPLPPGTAATNFHRGGNEEDRTLASP